MSRDELYMPLMSENSREHNPKRNPNKDMLYVGRGQRLVIPEKFEEWKELIATCSGQQLDRDVEFGLALNALEMMQLGLDPSEVAAIFAADVDREVELGRISPVQGCVARDIVMDFGPQELDFEGLMPESSFLASSYTTTL